MDPTLLVLPSPLVVPLTVVSVLLKPELLLLGDVAPERVSGVLVLDEPDVLVSGLALDGLGLELLELEVPLVEVSGVVDVALEVELGVDVRPVGVSVSVVELLELACMLALKSDRDSVVAITCAWGEPTSNLLRGTRNFPLVPANSLLGSNSACAWPFSMLTTMSLMEPASVSPARAFLPDSLLASANLPDDEWLVSLDDVAVAPLLPEAAFFCSAEILPASRSCCVITGNASNATLSICAVKPSAAACGCNELCSTSRSLSPTPRKPPVETTAKATLPLCVSTTKSFTLPRSSPFAPVSFCPLYSLAVRFWSSSFACRTWSVDADIIDALPEPLELEEGELASWL